MREITGHTRVFGTLADPIHHIKGPQLSNRLFAEHGFDGVMVPIHVRPADLATVLQGLRATQNLDGFIVTVPHKTAMLSLCDTLTETARRIGAVNIVRRLPDGRLHGGQLDGDGFVGGLRSGGIEPAGRSAYLAGAGGAASAIAFALAEAGVRRLTLHNRSTDKAQALRKRLLGSYPRLAISVGSADPAGHELVVNGTSLGMHDGDALPLDADRLAPEQTVAEIIMQPAETALMRIAREKGCRVHPGLPMLACQIALMAEFMGGPAAARGN